MQVSLDLTKPINTWEVQRGNCQDKQCSAASWSDSAHSKNDKDQAQALNQDDPWSWCEPCSSPTRVKHLTVNSVWLFSWISVNPTALYHPAHTVILSISWEGQRATGNFLLHPTAAKRTRQGSWEGGFWTLAILSALTEMVLCAGQKMALLKWKRAEWGLCRAGHEAGSKALPLLLPQEQNRKGISCCSCHQQQGIPELFHRHQVPWEAWSFTALPAEGQQEQGAPHGHAQRCAGGLGAPERSSRCHQTHPTGSWAATACSSSLVTLSKVAGMAWQKPVPLIPFSDSSAHLNYWDKCLHWEKGEGSKKWDTETVLLKTCFCKPVFLPGFYIFRSQSEPLNHSWYYLGQIVWKGEMSPK